MRLKTGDKIQKYTEKQAQIHPENLYLIKETATERVLDLYAVSEELISATMEIG